MSNTDGRLRVLIADDHPLTRDALRAMVEREPDMVVVGDSEGGVQAIAMYERLRPDVVLMDLEMPDIDGLDATAAIHKADPNAYVVILTTYGSDPCAARAISLGVKSCMSKASPRVEIIAALRAARDR
jgi:two-component system NarL family response regulator